jgi:hypothetical protein
MFVNVATLAINNRTRNFKGTKRKLIQLEIRAKQALAAFLPVMMKRSSSSERYILVYIASLV